MTSILYITRRFPPSRGGMERVSYELYTKISEMTNTDLVKWGGSNKWLVIVLPYFFLKACWILIKKDIDVIYIQDGLLSPLGLLLKNIFRKQTIITIHGRDITYKNQIYQSLIPNCVSKLDKIICISNATKEQCIIRNIPENKIVVIPNGVSDIFYIDEDKKLLRRGLSKKFGIMLENKKIILSVGRLIERKGFHWFIEEVLPRILTEGNDIIYLIAGDGPLKNKIKASIDKVKMEKYAFLLGRVSDNTLKLLYNSADLLLMPNIHVDGDMEGFGIVGLEAGSCDLPIIASNIEGMRDFVEDEINGFLVESKNIDEFIERIKTSNNFFNENIRKRVLMKYEWPQITKKYLEVFDNMYMQII